MHTRRQFLALLVAASTTEAIHAESSPATGSLGEEFQLTQDAAYKYVAGFGRELEVGVFAGRFRTEAATEEGRYLLAERPSVWWKAGSTYLLIKKAGLWVPANPTREVRFYYYNYAGHASAKSFEELRHVAEDVSGPAGKANPDNTWVPPGLAMIDLIVQAAQTGAALHPAPPSAEFNERVRLNLVRSANQ